MVCVSRPYSTAVKPARRISFVLYRSLNQCPVLHLPPSPWVIGPNSTSLHRPYNPYMSHPNSFFLQLWCQAQMQRVTWAPASANTNGMRGDGPQHISITTKPAIAATSFLVLFVVDCKDPTSTTCSHESARPMDNNVLWLLSGMRNGSSESIAVGMFGANHDLRSSDEM